MADADWKAKYYDAIRAMEDEERRFRAIERTLRRVVARLCTAARGLNSALDGQLDALTDANKREAEAPEMEALLSTLRDAVAALDLHKTQAETKDIAVPAQRWSASCEAVSVLLKQLGRDEARQMLSENLLAELQTVQSDDALATVLLKVADVFDARSNELSQERHQAAALLKKVTSQLDEVSSYLASQHEDRRTTLGDAEQLNAKVMDQVQELNQEVQQARDLAPLQSLVGERLELISKQVKEFRAREESRFLEQTARSQSMQQRITQLEQQTVQLNQSLHQEQVRARLDALTGIPNRGSFDERFREEIERWKRFRNPVSVLVWDIDYFKKINDTFGHRAGDRVLQEVAKLFADRLRTTDVLARYGGEEFVMLLIGTALPDAQKVANQLREIVGNLRLHFRGQPVSVSISCGMTELRAGDTAEVVFDRADAALYKAKGDGRNLCIAA